MQLVGFDIETWGDKSEYALQPYRVRNGAGWVTCCAWVMPTPDGTSTISQIYPHVDDLRKVLRFCSQRKLRIVGWNTAFDVAWLIALGLRDEVYACQWLDAMLLLKHLTVAPTFEGKPRPYGLKPAVEEFLPIFSGYADDVDFGG